MGNLCYAITDFVLDHFPTPVACSSHSVDIVTRFHMLTFRPRCELQYMMQIETFLVCVTTEPVCLRKAKIDFEIFTDIIDKT